MTNTTKIAVSLNKKILEKIDRLVEKKIFPDREVAIQKAIEEKFFRQNKSRLADESSKLNPDEEQSLAEEGIKRDSEEWMEY